jgi:ribose-phosphate pyrophosphokinase
MHDLHIFSGTSHPKLAQEIADELNVPLGNLAIEQFPDGEIAVQVLESVRGVDVFIVQSIALDPNRYLIELLIIIDALKRASAKNIIPVIPYFGYCRQDRKDRPRVPITAKLVANLLEQAGATQVLTMDLHAGQIQGFFDIPVDNLYARRVLVDACKEILKSNSVVVTPDIGSVKLARSYANSIPDATFAVIDKQRLSPTEVETVTLIGNVEGKNVLLADDLCSTAGTLVSAAKACQEKGALKIFAAVTHGLFVGDAVQKIQESPITTILAGNTIPVTERLNGFSKLREVSVAPLFAKAIRCVISKESISSLYAEDIL